MYETSSISSSSVKPSSTTASSASSTAFIDESNEIDSHGLNMSNYREGEFDLKEHAKVPT